MAGYIMNINDIDALEKCVTSGVYSTIMTKPKNRNWNTPQEGTFADYFSMKQGDSIYFFHKRKIYGIGKIVNVEFDCKYLNYIGADEPVNYSEQSVAQRDALLQNSTPDNRCLCTFIPAPYFFMNSVDMDEALSSNPQKFKILRTMWKVSFIKIDDEEDKALQDVILKRNEDSIVERTNIYTFSDCAHIEIENKVNANYRLNAYRILANAEAGNKIKHEMAIEAALCDILQKENDTPFGKWDYISHQVAASPFKPIDYMDKMDIFGYRYIDGYKTISKYLVIEIKRDTANEDVIDQIMKYVDWINQEYAHGDYSMIEAYVIASDFPKDVIEKRGQQCIRNFTKGYRPTQACTWNNCKLIKYSYVNQDIAFIEINNG